MDETPVLIVGSGPAGAATALELVRLNTGGRLMTAYCSPVSRLRK